MRLSRSATRTRCWGATRRMVETNRGSAPMGSSTSRSRIRAETNVWSMVRAVRSTGEGEDRKSEVRKAEQQGAEAQGHVAILDNGSRRWLRLRLEFSGVMNASGCHLSVKLSLFSDSLVTGVTA